MGVTFNKESNTFMFDFEHDGVDDIVSLTGRGYEVEAFGKCFYYGYEFCDQVESKLRGEFIHYVKFGESIQQNPNLTRFVQKAVNDLNDKINLYNYDLVVIPQSSSSLNQYMLRYLYRFAQPQLHYMELVKSLPEQIEFDMDAYEKQYLDDVLEDGRPRYSEKAKEDVRKSINEMMDLIHKKDYFTIAKDVRKSRMRPYITNFLRFRSEEDRALCEALHNQNVLVVDDITTSGSTLGEILRALRVLSLDNQITVFSLLGRQDLMAER